MSSESTLSDIIRNRASTQPDAVFAKVPRQNAYENGYRVVTNSALATAVAHVADLITSSFGRSDDFERIAYLGLNDLRYTVVLLAGIETGYTMFLPSPRNSEEAHKSLLATLACSKLVTTSPGPAGLSFVEEAVSEKLVIPTLDELLDLDPRPLPTKAGIRSCRDAKTDPIFVLHTSGSTGVPKPLVYTNEFVSRVYNTQTLVAPDGFESVDEKLRKGYCLVMLPPFHIAGLAFTLLFPALYDSVPIYPVAGPPPNLHAFSAALRTASPDWAFLSPVVVDEMGRDPDALDTVAEKLDYLFFTGGSVPQESGTTVARKIDLNQVLGSSECAAFPLLRSKNQKGGDDWRYVHVHPAANVEFRRRHDDYAEYYEMVQVRRRAEDCSGPEERYQPVFCHFDTESYGTKDLFSKHPTLPDTFKHVGRVDDIIVFLNGEKTNPVSFQDEVAEHPDVRAALVVGQRRQEAALLVEPEDRRMLSEKAGHELIEKIWPIVEECNTRCPRHARVSKTRIIVAPASMPFLRAGKGTVQRQSTLTAFKNIIDGVYRDEDETSGGLVEASRAVPLVVQEVATVVSQALADLHCKADLPTADFFSNGMDSWQVIQLRRKLREKYPGVPVTMSMIYSYPTVASLASSIAGASLPQDTSSPSREEAVRETLRRYQMEIDAFLEKRTAFAGGVDPSQHDECSSLSGCPSARPCTPPLTELPKDNASMPCAQGAVLLTGSTGSLGSHLLNTLLERETRMVYCLNRSADSRALQVSRNKTRGLPVVFPESRVKFVTGDPALPRFGLSDSDFDQLRGSVTHVIHNAWPVDFNKSLGSFAGCLDGIVGLIRFAYRSPHEVNVQLVSSITSVAGTLGRPEIPEEPSTDRQIPSSMGYGQSKYLAERMLSHASKVLGIKTMTARVGQISGDASRRRGWNRTEWFPSLVLSSLDIGALPDNLGCAEDGAKVSWIPVDSAARTLLEISCSSPTTGTNQTFHVLHPRPSAWEDLLPTIRNLLNEKRNAKGSDPTEVVPYGEWFKRLESSSQADPLTTIPQTTNPALKLLPFFESLQSEEGVFGRFAVGRSMTASSTMRALEPLGKDCLEAWVSEWIEDADVQRDPVCSGAVLEQS